jgi:putative ABC transport system permease protein
LSLFLLARRGLTSSSEAVGIDPLLVAAPLLLSAGASIAVLRIYPFPLLAVQRLARRARGAVSLVGAARAVREPALGAAAAFALVVGISVSVLSLVLSATTSSALLAAAQQSVGGDLRIESSRIDEEFTDVVAGVDEIGSVVGMDRVTRQMVGGSLGSEVTAVFTDTEELRSLRPDLPTGLADEQAGRIPLLISSDLTDRLAEGDTTIQGEAATIVGSLPAGSLAGVADRWVLIDERFLRSVSGEDFDPTWLLAEVEGKPTAAATSVREALEDAYPNYGPKAVTIIDSQSALDKARQAPVIAGLDFALALATIVALALSALTVIVASVAAAATRHRMLSVLRPALSCCGKSRRLPSPRSLPALLSASRYRGW